MKKLLPFFGLALMTLPSKSQTITFTYTGNLDSLEIPNCVDSILINVWGAQGETPLMGGTGGKGAYASGKLDVNAGDWIYITVGGQNGYNGGGMGGKNGYTDFSGTIDPGYGGWGGGASDIRVGGKTLTDRIIVAGGGGGGGHNGVWPGCPSAAPAGNGGDGSGIDGTMGYSYDCGCGGGGGYGGITATASAGGLGADTYAGFCGTVGTLGGDGILGVGGSGHSDIDYGDGGAGGGGGGYYGGGAGGNGYNTTPGGGGGGGSSYTDGVANGQIIGGVRFGNGQITITYILSSPIMTLAVNQSDITLSSLQSGVSYQWLNCGTGYSVIPGPGAQNQSFTASSNGAYAVELDNGNGCVDTTACYTITQVGLGELQNNFTLFPNPAKSEVQISLPGVSQANLQVIDLNGKKVLENSITQSTFSLNISSLSPGVYVVVIQTDEFILNKELIVE